MHYDMRNWRELCDLATKEPDPEKLKTVLSELIRALDERRYPLSPQEDPLGSQVPAANYERSAQDCPVPLL